MLIVGITVAALVGIGSFMLRRRHSEAATVSRPAGAFLVTAVLAVTLLAAGGITANAAIVPTVNLGTAADAAVLAGSTVTNTGNTVLNGSLGLSPGTSITGFPPGIVVPPATIDIANGVALQAQSDLTTAYVDAAGRSVDATTPADLTNLVLVGGVYAGPGPGKGALELSGPLVLDGEGNPDSVFIFQTDSTLITATGSTVSLINGAQACNVFWQVGSSATLGEDSVFVGNILALSSVSVGSNVVVEGRALARNAAVTLIDDVFTAPGCAPPSTTTTLDETTTTLPGTTTTLGGTTTTLPGTTTTMDTTTTTLPDAAATTDTTLGSGSTPTTVLIAGPTTSTTAGNTTTTSPRGTGGGELPVTGSDTSTVLLLGILVMTIGAAALGAGWAASKEASQ